MCALVALILLNSNSSHVGFAAKYDKVRKSNKEDVGLLTSARGQVSSKQFSRRRKDVNGVIAPSVPLSCVVPLHTSPSLT